MPPNPHISSLDPPSVMVHHEAATWHDVLIIKSLGMTGCCVEGDSKVVIEWGS